MSDIYVYTSKGYTVVEPDFDPPSRRLNCMRCGGFLPERPNIVPPVHHIVYDMIDYRDVTSGEIVRDTGPRLATDDEIARGEAEAVYRDPAWKCARCGHEHTPEDMYD